MELERVDRGLPKVEAVMLNDRKEGFTWQVFALRALGWGMRRIGREVGVALNTVRDWLRAGEDRQYGGESRPGSECQCKALRGSRSFLCFTPRPFGECQYRCLNKSIRLWVRP